MPTDETSPKSSIVKVGINICSAESYVYMFLFFIIIATAVRKMKVLKVLVLYDRRGVLNLTFVPCSIVGSAVHVSICVSSRALEKCRGTVR